MTASRPEFGKHLNLYRHLIMALLLNVPLIALGLMLNLRAVDFTGLAWLYTVCVIVGCYILPILIAVTLVWSAFFAFRRVAIILSGTILGLAVFYFFIDSFVYDIFKLHVDFFWLGYVITDYRGLGLPTSSLLVVLFLALAVFAAQIGIFALVKRMQAPRFLTLSFALLAILAFGLGQVMHIVAYQRNESRITSLTPHFPFYFPITSHKNALRYGDLLPIGADQAMADQLDKRYSSLSYPLGELRYGPTIGSRPPNVLFILLESWRYDMMNELVSPRIHAFSRRSHVFKRHYSSGNSTTAGVFGLFYGLHPTYWSAVKANSRHIDNPVLIDVMKENRYAFGIFADSNFERHKIKDTIFNGIEIHEEFSGVTNDQKDADLNRRLKAFLREQAAAPRPFMALAFYKSTHYDYCYPKRHQRFTPSRKVNMAFTNNSKDPQLYLNDFRNAVSYLDELVGDVIDTLDSLEIMDETVVIITTDHGEEFDDNGENYWGHGSNFTRYQVQVPLIVHFPEEAPRQVARATTHVDVAPTLLQDYFGCISDIQNYSNGRHLLDQDSGTRPFVVGSYVNHAFVIDDDVHAIYPVYTKRYKLYDIDEEAARPRLGALKVILEEIHRFYVDES